MKRQWPLIVVVAIAGLIGLQVWSTRDHQQQTDRLHTELIDTQQLALQLNREIGYGGLIHHFKNFVLRPSEDAYYERAAASADVAIDIINQLEAKAVALDINSTLTNSRAMVEAYQSRLDKVVEYSELGLTAAAIDAEIRFDDTFAIRENSDLLNTLSIAVTDQMRAVDAKDRILSLISIGGMFLLSALALVLIMRQQQEKRHVAAITTVHREVEAANVQLSTANTALQQFAGIVSHDLRAPVRHIAYYTEMIREDVEDTESVLQLSEKIHSSTMRIDRMINGLMDFTKTGFATPAMSIVDVAELVSEVNDALRPAIETTGADLDLNVTGKVRADPELLRRVVSNLISNSLKYKHPDQPVRISVTTEQCDGRVWFSFEDTGIGIDPKHADEIFEPWQRLSQSASDHEGEGLGLALVKSIVNAHQGQIRLDTQYSGGTRMVFDLASA